MLCELSPTGTELFCTHKSRVLHHVQAKCRLEALLEVVEVDLVEAEVVALAEVGNP
jgi:hypothetical protein